MNWDVQDLKARCSHAWPQVISALCSVNLSVLDTEHHPCPKCGQGKDCFNLDRSGSGGVFCNKCQPGTGDGIGTIRWFTGWDFNKACEEIDRWLGGQSVTVITDDARKLRAKVYSQLHDMFPLEGHHRAELVRRGLDEIEIEQRGYWTAPQSTVMKLLAAYKNERAEISKNVPGVMPGGSLTIAASNALMIPVRNADGDIIAIQYKPDNRRPGTPKYLWLSSKDTGVSPGSPCHFSLPPADRECTAKIVRLTEGPLKADIATALSGVRTLAIAGVNNWKVGVAGVKSLSPEFVWLAFDADAFTNPNVAKAVVETYDTMLQDGMLVQVEQWPAEHKGVDDALAAGATTTALPIEETRKVIDKLRTVAKERQIGNRLRNYKIVPSKSDDPNKAWDKEPIPVPEMANQLLKITDGWPKACKNVLFVKTADDTLRNLSSPNELFGWIGAKAPVDFYYQGGCIGKQEFYAELPYHIEQFTDIEESPHFPPIQTSYYAKTFEPGDGKRLDEFIDFFSPATRWDRELIMAFIATTFWGGSPGRRVCFGVDSRDGTGAGKSELVKRIASLSGGCYEFDAKKIDEDNIRKQLVNGEKYRVAVLDNVKESCLSSAVIESMVTSATISGHKLHVGYTTRPNTLTWAITMNGMSLSRDLAQRTVVIHLSAPQRSGTWDDDMDRFLASHRDDVIKDVATFFQRPATSLERFTRWASWERSILARLDNPMALQTMIENRAAESDEDKTTAKSAQEYFEEQLKELGYDTANDVIHIPSEIATQWMVDATGKEYTKRSAGAAIKNLIDGGSLKNFKPNPSRKNGRGWLWNGDTKTCEVKYTLEATLNAKKRGENGERNFF